MEGGSGVLWLVLLASSVYFYNLGPLAERWHHPHWDGPAHINHYCPTDQSDGSNSSAEIASSGKRLGFSVKVLFQGFSSALALLSSLYQMQPYKLL